MKHQEIARAILTAELERSESRRHAVAARLPVSILLDPVTTERLEAGCTCCENLYGGLFFVGGDGGSRTLIAQRFEESQREKVKYKGTAQAVTTAELERSERRRHASGCSTPRE